MDSSGQLFVSFAEQVWGGTPEGSIITWDLAKSGQMPRSPTSNRRSASPAPPSPALSRRGTTPAQFKFSGQMSSTNLKKVTRMGVSAINSYRCHK